MMHAIPNIGPEEARQRARMIAGRRKLFSRPKARTEAAPAHVERVWTEPHDSHVKAWRRHLETIHETPSIFLKRRCREMDIAHADIIGPCRAKYLVEARHVLVAEVKDRFPKDGYAKLARLFHRDHTTILYIIRKMRGEQSIRHRHEIHKDAIIALYGEGIQQKQIAEQLGCAASAVSRVLSMQCPDRPKRRMIDDYAARIEALFDEGMTYAEIAHRFGFDPSADIWGVKCPKRGG